MIKKVKNIVPWIYLIEETIGQETIATFYEKGLWKINHAEFGVEKLIKRNGEKRYVKWKGYDNSFNSLIDKKDIVIKSYSPEQCNQIIQQKLI